MIHQNSVKTQERNCLTNTMWSISVSFPFFCSKGQDGFKPLEPHIEYDESSNEDEGKVGMKRW